MAIMLPLAPPAYTPDEMRARVLYQDADVLVVDKPYGLPVHYGTKSTDHLERYLPWLVAEGAPPPRLAHRLDKDTTGCLVLGLNEMASTRLGKLFLAGRVGKRYWAVVKGRPETAEGRIELPLIKRPVPGCSRMMVDHEEGKHALTEWRLMATGTDSDGQVLSWLELTPRTGRMHQLRVHCETMGWPMLGDPIYGRDWRVEGGRDPAPAIPLHLHARWVALPWWAPSEPPLEATAPLSPHLAATFQRLGFIAENS